MTHYVDLNSYFFYLAQFLHFHRLMESSWQHRQHHLHITYINIRVERHQRHSSWFSDQLVTLTQLVCKIYLWEKNFLIKFSGIPLGRTWCKADNSIRQKSCPRNRIDWSRLKKKWNFVITRFLTMSPHGNNRRTP